MQVLVLCFAFLSALPFQSPATLLVAPEASTEEPVTANYSAGKQMMTVGSTILAGGCFLANDLATQMIDFGRYPQSYFDQHASTPEYVIRLRLRFKADNGVSATDNTALDTGIDGLMIPIPSCISYAALKVYAAS